MFAPWFEWMAFWAVNQGGTAGKCLPLLQGQAFLFLPRGSAAGAGHFPAPFRFQAYLKGATPDEKE
ncbi:MAG: hypothetical protein P4L75_05960 [Clostridia bacterium]|nr:hypothetical protein [Clostridia bacterium]